VLKNWNRKCFWTSVTSCKMVYSCSRKNLCYKFVLCPTP